MDFDTLALQEHKKHKGKLAVVSKVPLNNKDDLSTYYTPGVAAPCREIAKNPDTVYDYTRKGQTVAIISDGSAVLWLGNIWWAAGLPVMEGKAVLIKWFSDIDAIPIVLDTQDVQEIISTSVHISPTFGLLMLEDIKAPECFEIERRLNKLLPIPVFHDDQHGTAIVVLAALINACKATNKKFEELDIVIAGAGAAGTAIAHLLAHHGATQITTLDSKGALCASRDNLNTYKQELLPYNKKDCSWSLGDVIAWADVFIGVSKPDILTIADVQSMAEDPIVFALSNPDPEISEADALAGWAAIYAAGRSDVQVQINNILVFPWLIRWALEARLQDITMDHKQSVGVAIAEMVDAPHTTLLLPDPFDPSVVERVVAVMQA